MIASIDARLPSERFYASLFLGMCMNIFSAATDSAMVLARDRQPDTHTRANPLHRDTCVSFPFPQNVIYPFGLMPGNRNHVDALNSYNVWKNTYVTPDGACGFRRVLFNDMNTTYSEGIGYGMLLAAVFNDQALFDDLWRYYNAHLDPRGLMDWWIGNTCGQIIGASAATDADEDAAFALILAHQQWCSHGAINYLNDAITLISRIFTYEVEPVTYVLKPGDIWGGSYVTNPSYFAPAYYRIFAEVTNNPHWYLVIDKCYEILNNAAHSATGLVPDWCQADGNPAPGFPYIYYYDATRTPWRIALDYLWFGDVRAKTFCEKISSFARGIGSVNILEGYSLNGWPIGWQHNNVFVGPFGVGGMATNSNYQAFVDSAYQDNVVTTLPAGGGYYYNWSLKTLTLLVQTGNFYYPSIHPVPIQLAYFRGRISQSQTNVILEWGTLSEVNNYGFEVQRRAASGGEFVSLVNSFVPGHGTTTIPQHYTFTDISVPGGSYLYRLKHIDLDGTRHFTEAIQVDVLTSVNVSHLPFRFSLDQNYPNPFNPTTLIRYEVPHSAYVTITVHNILGQEMAKIVEEVTQAGRYSVTLRSDGWASGVYVCRMKAGSFVAERKMVLLR